jgi:hypothetical protein
MGDWVGDAEGSGVRVSVGEFVATIGIVDCAIID